MGPRKIGDQYAENPVDECNRDFSPTTRRTLAASFRGATFFSAINLYYFGFYFRVCSQRFGYIVSVCFTPKHVGQIRAELERRTIRRRVPSGQPVARLDSLVVNARDIPQSPAFDRQRSLEGNMHDRPGGNFNNLNAFHNRTALPCSLHRYQLRQSIFLARLAESLRAFSPVSTSWFIRREPWMGTRRQFTITTPQESHIFSKISILLFPSPSPGSGLAENFVGERGLWAIKAPCAAELSGFSPGTVAGNGARRRDAKRDT
jgi:hypothetical protein